MYIPSFCSHLKYSNNTKDYIKYDLIFHMDSYDDLMIIFPIQLFFTLLFLVLHYFVVKLLYGNKCNILENDLV